MPLELTELKTYHDKAYTASQITRENASDDIIFYWVTQWDDNSLQGSQLAYRGEFNILRKAGRQILADLAQNEVQNDFEPKEETREDSAELADMLYRAETNTNISMEAFANADQEAVVCGVGAWELYTKYANNRSGNNNQVVCRRPIIEANNTVYWDPNAKLIDKSDAKYVSVLTAYSEDGYQDLVKELTGEDIEVTDESFKQPEQSYVFPWIGGEDKKIYVTKFYYREKTEDKILTMQDPFGEIIEMRESELSEVMDDMIDAGYEIESEETITKYKVTKYIASGSQILKECEVPGEHIPIVPEFGEHAWAEGQEIWEGVTRLAKDPSRLRNFAFSYLADILSRSPRDKNIFYREQLLNYEDMYEENGADNNYPYLYQNYKDGEGNVLPIGAIGKLEGAQVPQSLPLVLGLTREAVEDVANPGLPQDIADPDVSGKAVIALQARLDQQSIVYQEHRKYARRRDAEIWASMAAVIYDVPRTVKGELPDGTKKEIKIMDTVVDEETGDIVTINDLRNTEFEVYSKMGPNYASQKEQTLDRLEKMVIMMDPNDPIRKIVQMKILQLTDGVDFEDVRDYVNKQMLLMGLREPETPEEEQMLMAAQSQQQEPDAATLLAQAENKKGDADLLEQQRKGIEMQFKAQNDKMQTLIDAFEAQTKRKSVQIDAEEANADISNKNVDTFGKQIENQAKVIDLTKLSNEDLYQRIAVG